MRCFCTNVRMVCVWIWLGGDFFWGYSFAFRETEIPTVAIEGKINVYMPGDGGDVFRKENTQEVNLQFFACYFLRLFTFRDYSMFTS